MFCVPHSSFLPTGLLSPFYLHRTPLDWLTFVFFSCHCLLMSAVSPCEALWHNLWAFTPFSPLPGGLHPFSAPSLLPDFCLQKRLPSAQKTVTTLIHWRHIDPVVLFFFRTWVFGSAAHLCVGGWQGADRDAHWHGRRRLAQGSTSRQSQYRCSLASTLWANSIHHVPVTLAGEKALTAPSEDDQLFGRHHP